MLDRNVIKEFLSEELQGINIPQDIVIDDLTETFCKFVEDDYYEWIKDNFHSFFNYYNPDWDWIRKRINNNKENTQ